MDHVAGSPIPLRYVKEVMKTTVTLADLQALAAGHTANILVGNLPERGRLLRALLAVDVAAAGLTALTASVGTNSTDYDDMLADADVKAAANTVYGDVLAEIGSSMKNASGAPTDMIPSLSAETPIYIHVDGGSQNVNIATAGQFSVLIEYDSLP